MAQRHANWTLASLAQLIGGVADGPLDLVLHRPVPAGSDDPHGITFAESEKYLAMVESSGVGAVILTRDCSIGRPSIHVDNPRLAFGMVLAMFRRPLTIEPGIHTTAVVSPNAKVDPTAAIGPFAVIADYAEVSARARVHAHCYVGEYCTVGEDAELGPRVTLVQDVAIGARSIIYSGAVLGADGFGFFWDGSKRTKVPQVGGVVVGEDVEIGANVTIDRATCGDTIIENGVKLDNLIQIGHNVTIGEHTVIAGLTGISGSVTVGKRVTMGGQVAVNDHTEIGDDVVLAGRTGVMRSVLEPGEYFGTPATPAKPALRLLALQRRLPEIIERLEKLERDEK